MEIRNFIRNEIRKVLGELSAIEKLDEPKKNTSAYYNIRNKKGNLVSVFTIANVDGEFYLANGAQSNMAGGIQNKNNYILSKIIAKSNEWAEILGRMKKVAGV